MDPAQTWVPIVGMALIFGLPVSGWIITRILQHRERMAMLQRGMVPPGRGWRGMNRGGEWGVPPSWGSAGPSIVPPPPQQAQYTYDDQYSMQCMLRRGLMTGMVGVALFIGLGFIGYHGHGGPFDGPYMEPGPWLLGGLIPMFVGGAQIIIALLSGAHFTLGRVVQPPPSPGPGPSSSYGTAEPGRPGPRYEELARPVPPPDRP
jgi:hypothetical protein